MKRLTLLILAAMLLSGCVYYNTFYHAKKFFNDAESSRKKDDRDEANGGERQNYEKAIKKSSKVLAEYPGSKYEDDALFVIGKSFYYIGDYPKAERKFRELLSSYPDSKYAAESRFFLGKSRYKLENYQLAVETLKRVVEQGKNSSWRAEALLLLGQIHTEQEHYDQAEADFSRFIEDFKSDKRLSQAYLNLGELFAGQDRYDTAAVLFGKAAAATEDPEAKYTALHQEGSADYEIDSVAAGTAIFAELQENPDYKNHLGEILLRLAEGHYLQGDWETAIRQFDEITSDYKGQPEEIEAYYMMGVIIQDDLDDIETAKEMFDWAARGRAQSEYRPLAMARSANIAKVTEYRDNLSSDQLDAAIDSRFKLAELYRETLNRPDSALREYQSLVEEYPGSEEAPKALLAIGWLYENAYHDTAQARDVYREVLEEYPYTDEYGSALELLGNTGNSYDTLTARKLYHLAENEYLDRNDLDSARQLFTDFKYRYPDSKLLPKAEFALANIAQRTYVPRKAPPGDSTFVDSTMYKIFARLGQRYAGTPIGDEATRLATGQPKEKPRQQRPQQQQQQQQQQQESDTLLANADLEDLPPGADTLSPAQIEELKLQKIIEELPLLDKDPTVSPEFNYPISAYGDRFEGRVMAKIKIEFDGKVTDVELLKPSNVDEIDREVERVLLETEFNPMEIDPLDIGGYFLYYYQVKLPDFLEGVRDQ